MQVYKTQERRLNDQCRKTSPLQVNPHITFTQSRRKVFPLQQTPLKGISPFSNLAVTHLKNLEGLTSGS